MNFVLAFIDKLTFKKSAELALLVGGIWLIGTGGERISRLAESVMQNGYHVKVDPSKGFDFARDTDPHAAKANHDYQDTESEDDLIPVAGD